MDRASFAAWDGSAHVTAWALVLVNAPGDILWCRAFGEPLASEVFYDGAASPQGEEGQLRDGLHTRVARTHLANSMSLALVLVNRGAPIGDDLAQRAKAHVDGLGAHVITDLFNEPAETAVEQREFGTQRLWVFDREMHCRLASVAYPRPPLYVIEAVRRFCTQWDWADPDGCPAGAFFPAPNVLLHVTPLIDDDASLKAAVNVQHVKERSLLSAIAEYGLTDREAEVLKLMLAGFRANEIGDALSIAESTVREHVKHVLVKTGSRNRVQMIARVLSYAPGVRHRLNNSLGMPN